MSWKWSLYTDWKRLRDLRDPWNALATQCEFPQLFSLYDFHEAWFEANTSFVPQIVVGQDPRGQVRFIAPFCSPQRSLGQWRYSIPEYCDYEGILVAAQDHEAFLEWEQWLRNSACWRRVQLRSLASESRESAGWFQVLGVNSRWDWISLLLRGKFPLCIRRLQGNHAYLASTDFAPLQERIQGRNYRKHENWFPSRGTLRFEVVEDPERILGALSCFFALHSKRWNRTGEAPAVAQRWFQALAHRPLAKTLLRFHGLWWDQTLLAAHLGFQWQGRLYWYLTAYDPDYRAHSPGKILFARVAENLEALGVQEWDFLRGEEAYKQKYATRFRPTYQLDIYRTVADLLRHKLVEKIS